MSSVSPTQSPEDENSEGPFTDDSGEVVDPNLFASSFDTDDITKSSSNSVDKLEDLSPLKLDTDPNYLTNFCKNRNIPHWIKIKNPLDSEPDFWEKYLAYAVLSGLLLLIFLWYLFMYYDLLIPLAGGLVNILKHLIIYCVILFVMVLFFKFLKKLSFWYNLWLEYLKLFLNPLINEKVSSAYCYFTNYVNWLIYYPAKLFYLVCLIGITLIFFLIIIPIIVGISFIIGKLFELLGGGTNLKAMLGKVEKTVTNIASGEKKPENMLSSLGKTSGSVLSSIAKSPGDALYSIGKSSESVLSSLGKSSADLLGKLPGVFSKAK